MIIKSRHQGFPYGVRESVPGPAEAVSVRHCSGYEHIRAMPQLKIANQLHLDARKDKN